MQTLSFGIPIRIAGREVVLCKDILGEQASRGDGVIAPLEPAGPDGRPPIFVMEDELRGLRESYPGLQVYGIWQLLFANNLVKLGHEVSVYRFSNLTGIYIRLVPGSDYTQPANIVESGEISSAYIAAISRRLEEIDYENIQPDISRLVLPARPARTLAEQLEERKQAERKQWVTVSALCAVMLAGAGIYSYAVNAAYSQEQKEYRKRVEHRDTLKKKEQELRERKLDQFPDNRAELYKLWEIYRYEPLIFSVKDGDSNIFGGMHLLQTSPLYPFDMRDAVSGVEAGVDSDGSWLVGFDASQLGEVDE